MVSYGAIEITNALKIPQIIRRCKNYNKKKKVTKSRNIGHSLEKFTIYLNCLYEVNFQKEVLTIRNQKVLARVLSALSLLSVVKAHRLYLFKMACKTEKDA